MKTRDMKADNCETTVILNLQSIGWGVP